MYVRVYVNMCACKHVCARTRADLRTHLQQPSRDDPFIFHYVCMYVCTRACMHVCIYVCMYVYVNECVYVNMCACVYVPVLVWTSGHTCCSTSRVEPVICFYVRMYPPKNGLIALWPSTNVSIPDLEYCPVENRQLLRLLSTYILVH